MARGDARRRGLPLAARACAARLVGIRQGSWGKEICTEPARRVRRHVLRRLDAEVGECGRVEVVAPGRRPVRRRLVLHIRHLCTDERESGRSARPCKTQLKPPRQKEAPPLTFYSRLPPRAVFKSLPSLLSQSPTMDRPTASCHAHGSCGGSAEPPRGEAGGGGSPCAPGAIQNRSFRAKHTALYASERDCERYDAELCRKQDHEGNLLRAIEAVVPLTRSLRVADVGAGTGKLARLLAPRVSSVCMIDRSEFMIAVARRVCGGGAAGEGSGGSGEGSGASGAGSGVSGGVSGGAPNATNAKQTSASKHCCTFSYAVADARQLPLADGAVELALSAWTLSVRGEL